MRVSARKTTIKGKISHTDVNYVAPCVNHDISIVPIFNLNDVASDKVHRDRLNEVQPSPLEVDCMFSAIFSDEEIKRVIGFGSSHLISRC